MNESGSAVTHKKGRRKLANEQHTNPGLGGMTAAVALSFCPKVTILGFFCVSIWRRELAPCVHQPERWTLRCRPPQMESGRNFLLGKHAATVSRMPRDAVRPRAPCRRDPGDPWPQKSLMVATTCGRSGWRDIYIEHQSIVSIHLFWRAAASGKGTKNESQRQWPRR